MDLTVQDSGDDDPTSTSTSTSTGVDTGIGTGSSTVASTVYTSGCGVEYSLTYSFDAIYPTSNPSYYHGYTLINWISANASLHSTNFNTMTFGFNSSIWPVNPIGNDYVDSNGYWHHKWLVMYVHDSGATGDWLAALQASAYYDSSATSFNTKFSNWSDMINFFNGTGYISVPTTITYLDLLDAINATSDSRGLCDLNSTATTCQNL